MAAENWRSVPGYEGLYEVSDLGRIRSLDRMVRCCSKEYFRKGRVLKPQPQKSGHLHVMFCRDGVKDQQMVHSVVAAAFLGPRPEGLEVRHLDGVAANNRSGNLRYGTHQQNCVDAYDHGNRKTGSNSHLSTRNFDLRELKDLKGKVTSQVAADRFGLCREYVSQIWRGEARRYG